MKNFYQGPGNMVEKELQRSFTSECQIVDRGWPALAGPYAQ